MPLANVKGMLISTVENEELRNGYLAQMLDEIRHTQQEMYLGRYYMKHYADPAGFDISQKGFGSHFLGSAGRAFIETFIAGDPIECSISLQVVGETAFTNPLFVAFPNTAAANGDHATPTVFLSIQSDEARHMANGYATLVAALSDDRNLPLIQEALDKYFWRTHMFIDSFLGTLTDYFSVNHVHCLQKHVATVDSSTTGSEALSPAWKSSVSSPTLAAASPGEHSLDASLRGHVRVCAVAGCVLALRRHDRKRLRVV